MKKQTIKFIINGTKQIITIETDNENIAKQIIKNRFKRVSKKIYFI